MASLALLRRRRTAAAAPLAPLRRHRTAAAATLATVASLAVVAPGLAPGAASAGTHAAGSAGVPDRAAALPRLLSQTGLFVPGSVTQTQPGVLRFAPQYVLWSDGAVKRRWIALPPGRAIDASRPDAWQFPRGTRLWKEFALGGRVETRYIERATDGTWRYGTYVWNAEGTDAVLAPARGIAALPATGAPDGCWAVPSVDDCRACHEGAAVPVLGLSALQLSPQRDAAAAAMPVGAVAAADAPDVRDFRDLVATGRLRGLPARLLQQPPRIPAAAPEARAALGYLHANCGHCHNHDGAPAPVRLRLAQSAADPAAGLRRVLASLLDAPPRYRPAGHRAAAGAADAPLVTPGRAQDSTLLLRMRSRHPNVQMPPLGTALPDAEGIALVETWIDHHLPAPKETSR